MNVYDVTSYQENGIERVLSLTFVLDAGNPSDLMST